MTNKTTYRGINLEIEKFKEDGMITLSGYQNSDGLEVLCYSECLIPRSMAKRLNLLCSEIDDVFNNAEDYGFQVFENKLKLLPDTSDYRHNRHVEMSGQLQIEDYENDSELIQKARKEERIDYDSEEVQKLFRAD